VTSQETSRRLTVQEAAEILGTSVDAVRMRIRRGSLESEKDSDGRVYVWVYADESETKPRLNGEAAELVAELRDRVRYLEGQLDIRTEELREHRRIIAALTSRIPELDAPETPPESPTEASGPPGTGGAQEGTERPWWRRMFGG
jgi:excisionase family DNA binding protein